MSIKNRNEKEILVGDNRFYLGEDNILYVTVIGDFDKEIALEMEHAFHKLLNLRGRKTNILVDNTYSGKPSPEAKAVFRKMMESEFTTNISIYGTNMVSRILASFVMGLTNNKSMHFSKTKEEAIRWFEQQV